jgi:hypothetical protein
MVFMKTQLRKVWRENLREEIYIACVGMVAFAMTIAATIGEIAP